jgi:hypothetical protein
MITEVGGKILDRFAECLADKLAPAQAPEPVAEAEPTSAAEPAGSERPAVAAAPESSEPLDLLDVAGAPVAKRAVVLIGAALLLIVIVAWLRRR